MTQEQARLAIHTPQLRREIVRSLTGWLLFYLPHYITLTPATFHSELLQLLADHSKRFLSIIGFRGSGKSSYSTLALPLWAALEHPKRYPFIVLFSDTEAQARINIANLRYELENNAAIRADYGDLSQGVTKSVSWTQSSLLLANGVLIIARSRGQRIRGLRHREHRPALVIVDDPEDAEKVQKKEYRDKTERWLRGELMPAIEESAARLVVDGNMLHTDALMARLKKDTLFEHRSYALFDDNGNVTWRAKYPTELAIEQQKRKAGPTGWLREYCLKVVPPEGQEVKEEWITYYDSMPEGRPLVAGIAVDLAIGKTETSDYTAMVTGVVYQTEAGPTLFILPQVIRERYSFHETISALKSQNEFIAQRYGYPLVFIEDVAYQRAAIEEAQRQGIPARGVKVTTDKRARLRAAATFIQTGQVRFPRDGAGDVITELLGFGIESHDDLVDATTHLIMGLRTFGMEQPEIILV